jgi:hypothetical protein
MAVIALCFDDFTSEKKIPVPIERDPESVWAFLEEDKIHPFSEIQPSLD